MRMLSLILTATPLALFAFAYVGYPLLLRVVSSFSRRVPPPTEPTEWPTITITVPSYNEEASIRATVESLLSLDYPPHRRQILIISDASTDRTDDIVREYEAQGVDLLRLPHRRGKTAAENAAGSAIRGDIVVNIDATIRLMPTSLKALVRAFEDPGVGVASGRDISAGKEGAEATRSESSYVGYENVGALARNAPRLNRRRKWLLLRYSEIALQRALSRGSQQRLRQRVDGKGAWLSRGIR